jgi:ankyrin repeat protein
MVILSKLEIQSSSYDVNAPTRLTKNAYHAVSWGILNVQPAPKCILLDAASRGDLSKVREPLGMGIFHSLRGALGDTPLMRAAQKGHKEVAVALVEQGALVSDRQVRGSTALHLAVAGGRSEMVTLLLGHGADISAVDGKHRSLLRYAIGGQPNPEVVQLLLNRGGPCSIPG